MGTKWVIARRGEVLYSGEQLSTPAYAPDSNAPTAPWMPALVPGTVLGNLVENGLSLDPNVGLDSMNIPDIGKTGPDAYTYWFCTHFDCNMSDVAVPFDRLRWMLEFDGINYSFELYLNGSPIPIPSSRGMFLQHRIDLGQLISNGSNFFAVLVYPPDHFGRVEGGGQGGDHALALDVAAQFFEGWDWIIPVADRGTGIWGDVRIRSTGDIQLSDPWASTTLSAEPSPPQGVSASVFASVCVTNVAPETQSVVLNLHIEHLDAGCVVVDIVASETVTVLPKTSIQHTFDQCVLTNALLWWPIDMGDQPLYTMVVEATMTDTSMEAYATDTCETTFGVRHLESYLDTDMVDHSSSCCGRADEEASPAAHVGPKSVGTGGRVFVVNGKKIFVRGANYICSDMLLRQPAARVWHEVRLHAQARVNLLRCWGGAGCQPRAFYEACDAFGLLVWVEFWITADDDGRGGGSAQNPLDHDLFLRSAECLIRAARGHPSVAVYVGGNEQTPCADLSSGLRERVQALDGTRAYVPGSLWDGFADGKGATRPNSPMFWDGPYGPQDPRVFFDSAFYPFAFNPEVGSVGLPEVETLRLALPGSLSAIPEFVEVYDSMGRKMIKEVVSAAYQHHCYMAYGDPEAGTANQLAVYGLPTSLEDYCIKGQLANYVQYRALVEGLSSRMWSQYTGFLIWKTQNPWYGLRGQMYDWRLQPNAALYAIRCAAEPVHVQLCPREGGVIQVVNATDATLAAKVLVRAVALDGKDLYNETVTVRVLPQSVAPVLIGLPEAPASPAEVFFLGLDLTALALGTAGMVEEGSECRESSGGKDTGGLGARHEPEPQPYASRNTYWLTRQQLSTDAGPQPFDEFAELSTWRRTSASSGSGGTWLQIAATGSQVNEEDDNEERGERFALSDKSSSWSIESTGHAGRVTLASTTTRDHAPRVRPRQNDAGGGDGGGSRGGHWQIELSLNNASEAGSGRVAMFVRVSLPASEAEPEQGACPPRSDAAAPAAGGASPQPLLVCSDNYITLLPGDARILRLRAYLPPATGFTRPMPAPPTHLAVTGFNVEHRLVKICWQ